MLEAQTNDESICEIRECLKNGTDMSKIKSTSIEMIALLRERRLLKLKNDILS